MSVRYLSTFLLGFVVFGWSPAGWADQKGSPTSKRMLSSPFSSTRSKQPQRQWPSLSFTALKLPAVKLTLKRHTKHRDWLAQGSQGEMIDNDKNTPRAKPVIRRKVVPPKPKFRKYGIELRGGMFFFPEFMLNALFFDESEGVMQGGFGAGFVLRTDKTFEYIFAVSYNFFGFNEAKDKDGKPIPHVFLNKGDPTFQREFVQNNLSYLAIDVRFQKTFDIHPRFNILLGGGVGLGIILGQLKRTDTFIPGYSTGKEEEYKQAYKLWRSNPQDQTSLPNIGCNVQGTTSAQQTQYASDKARQECTMIEQRESRVPPVIPVFDFILGMVFPIVIDRWDIRIQGGVGLPKLFWFSMATHIYF